jgi:gamma-glutamyltranspeptidase/glutathione hydrolase
MSQAFTSRPELSGAFGAIASTHWLATQAGMRMLEIGGNAFDAAAAAGFVLQVVEPHQNGLGGEAPMLLYSAAEDSVLVVDGQGPAPGKATPAAFRALGLDLVPGRGLLAACVPGAFGAWMLVLERFGSLPLREVLAPAIGYARGGFPALHSLSAVLAEMASTFLESWPASAELWLTGHRTPKPGDHLTNRPLADTYERLLDEAEAAGPERGRQLEAARRAFYEGFVAETLGSFATIAQPDGLGVHAGLLTADDLADWRPSLEAPVRLAFRDFEVCKTGPWGQGPVLLQQLALLDGFDLTGLGLGSPDLVHVMAECAKLAFADREAFYGDPRATDVPLDHLLSTEYSADRRQLVGEEASLELRPGAPGGRVAQLAEQVTRQFAPGGDRPAAVTAGTGDPSRHGVPHDSRDTCHLDVADRFGNLVSATPSGGWLQSSPAVPGLGFCLGTRAQMFWLEEGLPATLRPGTRPRTTLSPALALRDGSPYLAFGTPGGDQQDQWPLRVFLNHAVFDLPLQAAIDTASWHLDHAPSSFYPRQAVPGGLTAEATLGSEVLGRLAARGHRLSEAPAWSLGRVTAVSRSPDGRVHAAADARSGQAYAAAR